MTVSPFASQVKIDAALTALGADLIGQTEQQLLQQLVVAAATASGGGGGGGGAVTSVNGQTGVVVLDPEDIGLTLPISISNGGTGSTTADAARIALGIEETTSAIAQVISVFVQDNVLLSWAGNYIDIDNVSVIYRFWFSVNGTGTAPSTPSGGVLTQIALTSGTTAEDAALDIASAINAYLTTDYLSNGLFSVTNSNAGAAAAPSSTFAEIEVSVLVPGENAGTRLAPADGSALTDVTATTIPAPTATTLGGVLTSEGVAGQFVKGVNTSGNLIYSGLGTTAIANGGTGQTTAVAAFDALAPTTTKGDLIVHNGTDNIRVAVGGTNGHVLTVDSAEVSGVKWAASSGGGGGGGASNIWLPAAQWIPKTTLGCGVDSIETTTNDQNFDQLLFDAGADEFADALVILPNNWNNGTITARFYWTSITSSGNVVWGIQARAFSNDDALDTAAGTAQTVTDTLTATNDMCVTSATLSVTIAGTPAENTPVQFTVYRDANAGGDTLAGDARLLGVEILYTLA